MDPIQIVATGYDRLADQWDDWTDTVQPDVRLSFAGTLSDELPEGAAVVELGCGTGRPVGCSLSARFDYLGVDVSSEMVRRATANCPNGRFQTADMSSLVFPDASFAGVVALYSVIHVPRDRHAPLFESVFRWLEPGGWFIGNLGTSDLASGVDEDWLGNGEMYWSGWDAAENLSLLNKAGFTVVSAEIVGQLEGDQPVEFQWVRCQKPRP